MKRIVLVIMLLLPAILGYGQEGTGSNDNDEYGHRVPDAIVHLAKSLWLHFPKADKVHYNYKGRLIVNENDFELNLLVPADSLPPLLKDSIEAALSHEQANATMAHASRDPGPNGDVVAYSLAWLHGRRSQYDGGEDERERDSITSNNSMAIVEYYESNHHVSFSFKFNNLKAILESKEPYDVTGLDKLLEGLKREYKTKKKKVILTADGDRSTGIGYEYVLECDGEKVFDGIRNYVGNEYLMKHSPLVSFNYYYDTDMMTITMFKQANEDGGSTRNRLQDREIQICSRNGKLLIIDVTNQNDRNSPCSILSWWDALLEGPDNHYLHPGKITKTGNVTTFHLRDEVYRMKRKNMFSSTYIFEKGL